MRGEGRIALRGVGNGAGKSISSSSARSPLAGQNISGINVKCEGVCDLSLSPLPQHPEITLPQRPKTAEYLCAIPAHSLP